MAELPLDGLARAFDEEAAAYDGKYAGNAVMAALRERFRARALEAFPPGARILELGAGTGEETAFLLGKGFRLLATDPSEEMLRLLRARAPGAETLRLSTRELGRLPPRSFGGAAAFWGPLNYDEDAAPALAGVAAALRPGGRFLFTSVNRWCLREMLHHAARGNFGAAFRRLAPAGVPVPVGKGRVPAFCPTAGALRAAARAAGFRVLREGGLGVFLPPPFLARPGVPAPRFSRVLEEALADRRPIRFFGDHLWFDLEVKT